MNKKWYLIVLLCIIMFLLYSYNKNYIKFQDDYYNAFDTYSSLTVYTKNEKNFKKYSKIMSEKLDELNKLFDIYNNYEGINNIKTINDNAGIKPIVTDKILINLLKNSKKAFYETDGSLNIAMGSVLKIWHEYRQYGINNPENAKIPPMETLLNAQKHTNIEDIVIDEEKNTVFIKDSYLSIDVGATAKGYGADLIYNELVNAGMKSGIINIGGNVKIIGNLYNKKDGKWSIGIQSPDSNENSSNNLIDTIYTSETSVVTSGDYQRYYTVNGKKYHHIIDPKTLMPADYYKSVTVINNNSMKADIFSTSLFVLPYEKGFEIAEKNNIAVMWILKDGTIKTNSNYNLISKNFK